MTRVSLIIDRVINVVSNLERIEENSDASTETEYRDSIKVWIDSEDKSSNRCTQSLPNGHVELNGKCTNGFEVVEDQAEETKQLEPERKFSPGVGIISTDLLFMYQSGMFVDIKLVAGNQTFYAHK